MLNWLRDKFFNRQSIVSREPSQISNRSQVGLLSSYESSSVPVSPMITQETSNPHDKVTLHIIKDGEVWIIEVFTNQVISDLIDMATSHFLDPKDSYKLSLRYKFVSVLQQKILNHQCTVGDEELRNNYELLLLPVISTSGATPKQITLQDIKGPSQEEITAATADLIKQNPVQVIPTLDCQENFQSEIRKVLYSLVEASAKILSQSPDAKVVFDGIAARINAKTKKEIDKNAIKYLKDMGFTESQARYALRLKRNRQIESMEWLLENSHRVKETVDEEPDKPVASTSVSSVDEDPLLSIKHLLQDIRDFQQRYFEPSPRALDNLVAMGFDPDDVVEALRVTDNNQVTACEWLCGERGSSVTNPSVSLDTDGQLYTALMNNPAIQLGLHNPKIMLAFLSILENPTSANLWLNDIDAAPVLGQIFKTYHSEKHMMIVKQRVELMKKQQTQS